MEETTCLNAVLETSETLSAMYRKSGDSEECINAYQAWDSIAEKLRVIAGDDDQVREFEDILRYILFKDESELSNDLVKLGMLRVK